MIEEIKTIYKQIESDNELYPLIASTCKKAIDAFIDKGFTREEAFQLLIHYSVKQS